MVRHPAAPYAVRVRCVADAERAEGRLATPAERDARCAQALEMARRVREALAA